jgi:hypothetical protein
MPATRRNEHEQVDEDADHVVPSSPAAVGAAVGLSETVEPGVALN